MSEAQPERLASVRRVNFDGCPSRIELPTLSPSSARMPPRSACRQSQLPFKKNADRISTGGPARRHRAPEKTFRFPGFQDLKHPPSHAGAGGLASTDRPDDPRAGSRLGEKVGNCFTGFLLVFRFPAHVCADLPAPTTSTAHRATRHHPLEVSAGSLQEESRRPGSPGESRPTTSAPEESHDNLFVVRS